MTDIDPEATLEGQDFSDLNYRLPNLVDALNEGFKTSLAVASVVSTLLAGSAAQTLGTIKSDMANDDSTPDWQKQFLISVSLAAISLNFSATINALCVIDRLSQLPISAKGRKRLSKPGEQKFQRRPITTIWKRFDGKEGLIGFLYFCWLTSFVVGVTCNFLQLALYAWSGEELATRIVTTCVVAISWIPLAVYIFWAP